MLAVTTTVLVETIVKVRRGANSIFALITTAWEGVEVNAEIRGI